MSSHTCHDLKTDRPGISGGLPGVYKLVPLAFYLALVAGLLLNGYNVYQLRTYKVQVSEQKARAEEENREKDALMAKQHQMMVEVQKAENVANWLKGARPVQPIVLQISRSFGANSTVSELSLTRNPEIPDHTAFEIKINGDAVRQLESTISALNSLNYFSYSSQQVQGDNALDYQATLVWRDRLEDES